MSLISFVTDSGHNEWAADAQIRCLPIQSRLKLSPLLGGRKGMPVCPLMVKKVQKHMLPMLACIPKLTTTAHSKRDSIVMAKAWLSKGYPKKWSVDLHLVWVSVQGQAGMEGERKEEVWLRRAWRRQMKALGDSIGSFFSGFFCLPPTKTFFAAQYA